MAQTETAGAMRNEARLMLQSRQAQMLVNGRKEGEGKAMIIGLTRFASLTHVVWSAAKAMDPYAHWRLCQIDEALEDAKKDLAKMKERAKEVISDVPALDIGVAHSIKPYTVPLQFSNAYSYRGSYLLATYDEIICHILTAKHMGLLVNREADKRIHEAGRAVRKAYTSVLGYKVFSITSDDVTQMTKRGIQAKELMGEIPEDILSGVKHSPYAPEPSGPSLRVVGVKAAPGGRKKKIAKSDV